MTKCAEWQSFIWLIFIALALCLFCHSVKNHHAYEDKNRMTKCAEWQSFIWLIFTALALCLFCHSVKIKTPAGIKNKYALSVILSKNHHAYEDMNRMTKCAERQSFIWLIFIALALCLFCSFCQKKSCAFRRENKISRFHSLKKTPRLWRYEQNDKMCRMTEFYLANFHCVSFMSFLSFCQNKDARRNKE